MPEGVNAHPHRTKSNTEESCGNAAQCYFAIGNLSTTSFHFCHNDGAIQCYTWSRGKPNKSAFTKRIEEKKTRMSYLCIMLFEEMSMKAKRTHMIQKMIFLSVIPLYSPTSLNNMSFIAMFWYSHTIAKETFFM